MRVHRLVPVAIGGLVMGVIPAVAAAAPTAATVHPTQAVYAVDSGGTARITVTLDTATPLSRPFAVPYAIGAPVGAAAPGRGTLVFPAGSAAGATRTLLVPTTATRAAQTAQTVPVSVGSARATVVINAHGLPYLDRRLPTRVRVADLLSRMTLAEKVGQMTQAERGAVTGDPTLVATWLLGSVLSGGGSTPTPNTPAAWADMVDTFQAQALATRLQIPILYGVDTVHGHGNLVGATVFPHNINLGATRDPELVRRVEHVAAAETRATGPQWAFAPCVCVARDTRWGRTYESFGESPTLAAVLGAAAIRGFQGPRLSRPDSVLATAKHFAGDGLTTYGTAAGDYQIDQGITIASRADFDRLALTPYRAAVRAGVGSAMPSFSSVDFTEDGVGNPVKMHANNELITGVLKGQMRFGGFVISDWEGIHQIPGDWPTQVRTGVNAGTDMFMEPFSYQSFETTLLDEVGAGRVTMARIDDAVRRILTAKFELGLFERPFTDRSGLGSVGSASHRALARQAVAESQVLLKNDRRALPLHRSDRIYVAGSNADDIGNQSGGWTVQWQGVSGDIVPGTTVLAGIRQVARHVTYSKDGTAPTAGADVGVVVVGETPYAEGFGDVGGPQWSDNGVLRGPKSLSLSAADQATVDRVCSAIARCVVLVVAGRPQVIPAASLRSIDALVFSGLPGTEGAGVADVLFGRTSFTGRLSQTWPRTADQEPINIGDADYRPLYPYGWGLTTGHGLRNLVQARVAAGAGSPDAAALIAAADEQLVAGHPDRATQLLRRAGRL